MNIFLIEDNLADRMLTQEAFKNAPIANTLHCFEDGEHALEYLGHCLKNPAQKLPNIILSDMNLPGKGGHDVLRELKQCNQSQHIPVIILSGSIARKDIELSLERGAAAHLLKPNSMDDFFKLASDVLQACSTGVPAFNQVGSIEQLSH